MRSFFPFKNRLSQSYGPYSSATIDVKTGSPDPADFATTRLLIQMYPLVYRAVTALICQWSHKTISRTANTHHLIFLLELPLELYNTAFFGDHRSANLADHRKLCANCHNGTLTLSYTVVLLQKYVYDGPKYKN
jgi:hypothetical protein